MGLRKIDFECANSGVTAHMQGKKTQADLVKLKSEKVAQLVDKLAPQLFEDYEEGCNLSDRYSVVAKGQ